MDAMMFGSEEPRERVVGFPLAAWFVILAMVGLIVVGRTLMEQSAQQSGPGEDIIGVKLMEAQAKYMVAANDLNRMTAREFEMVKGSLNRGTVSQRLRFVILAAELQGEEEARNVLDELIAQTIADAALTGREVTEEQMKAIELLHSLYAVSEGENGDAPAADRLDASDRDWLVAKFGWFGRLALTDAGPPASGDRRAVLASAQRVLFTFLAALGGGLTLGVLGFVGLIVLTVFVIRGNVRSKLGPSRGPHGVYAETFALWIALFIGLQLVALELGARTPSWALMIVFVSFFSSLIAIIWPVLRGVPWATVRHDCGLTLASPGSRPMLEPLLGIAGYAMALPVLVAGVLITLFLILIQAALTGGEGDTFGSTSGPAHPIIAEVIGPNWWPKIQVLMLAAIAAPVVEEIMFRGVLYRHLREISGQWGLVLSIMASTAINSFIFAVIHPQGWVAVPALMSLAIAFCLAREWRGTVLVPMIMHGVSNGLVMTMMIAILA